MKWKRSFYRVFELTPALYKGKLSRVCVLAPPPSVSLLVMPVPSYTIDNALPRLYALSLPPDTLSSPFYIPNEGFPNFLQYRMRVFTHTLLRAITHDFIHTESLPGFPRMELLKLHEWIEILMLHFVRKTFIIFLPPFD